MGNSYTVVCDSSDRKRWLSLRSTGIGASEIAAVLGEDPWTSALELYDRKVNPRPVDGEPDEPEWLEIGRKIEDFIASLYAERTGREIRKAGSLIRSTRKSWAIATLDYEVCVDSVWCPLEIKNVGSTRVAEWAEGAPPHYQLQGQQQAYVTDSPIASFAALAGGNRFMWCDVPSSTSDQNRIVVHGGEFWSRVENRDPPMPDGSESAARAIGRMHPHTFENTIQLSGEFVDLASQVEETKSIRRAADKQIKTLEQRVKLAMMDNEFGVLPDGRVFSYRTIVKEAHSVARSEYRRLYLHKSSRGKK